MTPALQVYRRFTARFSARNYTRFMSCEHIVIKSEPPMRQLCGSASNTKADCEGNGLRETTVGWRLSYAPVAINLRGYRDRRQPQNMV